jgi:hypothetical protein
MMILTESQERQHRDAALEQKGGGNWCGTAHTCETGSGGTSCTTKLSCSRLGQSHFSDRCPMPLLAAKKVEIRAIVESSTDHRSPPTTMTVATLPRDDDGGLVMIPPCERTVEGCWKTCQLHASGDFDMLQG